MKKLMKKALKKTAGKNGQKESQAIPCPGMVVIFCVNAQVDGLIDVLGFAFPVTDADARRN
jgi:hypothetical protein